MAPALRTTFERCIDTEATASAKAEVKLEHDEHGRRSHLRHRVLPVDHPQRDEEVECSEQAEPSSE